jgi:hypothetical protein
MHPQIKVFAKATGKTGNNPPKHNLSKNICRKFIKEKEPGNE